MPNIAYIAVVIAGAAALWIEAHRQFAKPAEDFSSDRYSVLKGVESYQLCTPGEYLRGYMFYVAFYLVIYAALLTSAELRSLLQETATGQRVAGAQDFLEADQAANNLLDPTNYGMPIFLSAAIIALLSTGLAARFEVAVRAAAYRLAGIPRGVYRVIGEVGNIRYADIERDRMLPLEKLYTDSMQGEDPTPLRRLAIEETREALRVVDLLRQSVVDDYGSRFWSSGNVRAVEELIRTQRQSVNELEADIQALKAKPADERSRAFDIFHLKALEVRDNLQALFAVLFIRGGRTLPTVRCATAVVIKELQRAVNTPRTADVVTSALVYTAIGTLVGYCLVDLIYQYLRANDWVFQSVNRSLPEVFLAEFPRALKDAVFWTGRFLVFFGIAAGLAVIVQGNRDESGRTARDSGRFPVLRYCLAAVLPALAATVALLLVVLASHFLQFYLEHGSLITRRQMAVFLRLNFPFHLTYVFLGALIACCIYLISDNHTHKNWHAARTVTAAVGFTLGYLAVSYIGVAVTYGFTAPDPETGRYLLADYWFVEREAAFHVLPAAFFFISFAWLIERVEAHPS